MQFIIDLTPNKNSAWNCGTGNGPIAKPRKDYFTKVSATDINQAQLDQAPTAPNVYYSLQSAEQTDFNDDAFDLMIVGQAIHWFDFDKFYAEVRRTSTTIGIVAAIGYGNITTEHKPINQIIQKLYANTLGDYWDAERTYIDEAIPNNTIPFQRGSGT